MVAIMGVIMRISVIVSRFHLQHIECPKPYSPFCADIVGESAHLLRLTLQDDAFHAVEMVQPYNHARCQEIMVRMLHLGKALWKRTDTTINHIGKIGNAMLRSRLLGAPVLQPITDEITHSF